MTVVRLHIRRHYKKQKQSHCLLTPADYHILRYQPKQKPSMEKIKADILVVEKVTK